MALRAWSLDCLSPAADPWFDSLPDTLVLLVSWPSLVGTRHTQEPGLELGELNGKLGLLQGSTRGMDDVT